MGGYSSIEELKNDENIRNLIKESINSIFEMQEEYYESTQKTTNIETKSDVLGSNSVDSGGGVMIGSGKKGITIKQKTKLETEIQTIYYSNFLSKNDNPVIQLVSSDMLNMTTKDNSEHEMPNFYDPIYIMNMIGYNTKTAEFDFENDRIKYVIDYGEANEQIKEQNISEYENKNEEQKQNLIHNETHKEQREKYLKLQNKLSEMNKEYNKILESTTDIKGSDIADINGKISIIQQNIDKYISDLYNNKLIKKEYSSVTNKELEKLNKSIIEHKIYIENHQEVSKSITESDDEYAINIQFITDISNKKEWTEKYNDEEMNEFINILTTFINKYNEVKRELIVSISEECIKNDKYEETDRNELDELLNMYLSETDKFYELNIKLQQLKKEFEKNNPDISEKLKSIGEEIKTINAILSTSEALSSLKYYEYYETEPITRELLSRINSEIALYYSKMETKMETNSDNSDIKNLQTEYDKAFTSYTFAIQDKDYCKIQIQNNKAYQNNYNYIMENETESDEMKEIRNKILNSDVYKKTCKDNPKLIRMPEIVYTSQDETLLQLYHQYMIEREKHYSNITLEYIINYKHESNKDEDVKKLKEDYKQYIDSDRKVNLYKYVCDLILEKIKEMDTYNETDTYNEYVTLSEKWQRLRTAEINIENILNNYESAISDDYQYMNFEQLYQILTSGYMSNITEKITNITEKVKNLETNITRSTYNFAQNKVSIIGIFEDVNLEQNNEGIQKMIDNIKNMSSEAQKLTKEKEKENSTNVETESKVMGFINENYIILIIILISLGILLIASIIYYKRKKTLYANTKTNK